MSTTIEYVGMTSDFTYWFKMNEDGDVIPMSGVNETGSSSSLRFILTPRAVLPMASALRFYDTFRLYGVDGQLTTEWNEEEYLSNYALTANSDGTITLTSTPQKTPAQIQAERAQVPPPAIPSAPSTAPAVMPPATTSTPAASPAATGMGIGALVLGAFALYAFLS